MQAIQAIILDVDGTLVDSNDAHARAWVEALAEQGRDIPFEKVRRLIGMGGDKLLPQVGVDEQSREGKTISKRRSEIFKERYLPSLKPTPGARELLQRLHALGFRMVVASSAKKDELDALLRICGGKEVIESKTSADDADRSKPDPDILQAALEDLDLPPEKTVMLGDTPYDVEAAQRAGVATIAFRCGGWNDTDLTDAVAVYDDPADLLIQLGWSPLAGMPR
jgi:HAD superfamily hydrolase (TIGR01509 family)